MSYDNMTDAEKARFEAVRTELSKNFPPSVVEWKPQATNENKAQAVCFVDPRVYEERLTQVAPGWERSYPFICQDGTKACCRLTIMGVTREATGEAEDNDKNKMTASEAQAFKRACSAFGLGSKFYFLGQLWVAYDAKTKKLQMTPELPRWYLDNCFEYTLPSQPVRRPATTGQKTDHSASGRKALAGNPADLHLCSICQAPLFGGMGKNNKPYTAETLVDLSVKLCGQPLCYEHYQMAKTTVAEADAKELTVEQVLNLCRLIIAGSLTVDDYKAGRTAGVAAEEILT